ncbi:MAG TPA: hypothetical protein VND92_08980 [Vicinamibacterales bacterium]|nr:hypothetical protein [Vicinamibacterales bacterium]
MALQRLAQHFALGFERPIGAADAEPVRAQPAEGAPPASSSHRAWGGVAIGGAAAGAVADQTRTQPLLSWTTTIVLLLGLAAAGYLYEVGLKRLAEWRRQARRLPLELTTWLALAGGIFVRQNLDLANGSWTLAHASASGFGYSIVIALAVFPYAMRLITAGKPRPGLEVLAFPFSFGFFLDLARLSAVTWLPKLIGS